MADNPGKARMTWQGPTLASWTAALDDFRLAILVSTTFGTVVALRPSILSLVLYSYRIKKSTYSIISSSICGGILALVISMMLLKWIVKVLGEVVTSISPPFATRFLAGTTGTLPRACSNYVVVSYS